MNKYVNWTFRAYVKEVRILEKVNPSLCNSLYMKLDKLEKAI